MEKISIIVPVYNVEAYLGECIESILRQSYDNLEIILVDDGSTDFSGELCEEYARRDTRIQVLHQENGGMSCARNSGIERAQGELLMFVDSDDVLHPEYVARLHETLQRMEAQVAVASFEKLYGDKGTEPIPYLLEEKVYSGREILESKKNEKNYGVWTVVWNKIYRRELFSSLSFPVGRYHEDEFLANELFLKCERVAVIPDSLYYYRQREGSIMKTLKLPAMIDYIEANLQRIEIYHREQMSMQAAYKVVIFALEYLEKCYRQRDHWTPEQSQKIKELRGRLRQEARRLQGSQLGFMKQLSLLFLNACPVSFYRMMILGRPILERFL